MDYAVPSFRSWLPHVIQQCLDKGATPDDIIMVTKQLTHDVSHTTLQTDTPLCIDIHSVEFKPGKDGVEFFQDIDEQLRGVGLDCEDMHAWAEYGRDLSDE